MEFDILKILRVKTLNKGIINIILSGPLLFFPNVFMFFFIYNPQIDPKVAFPIRAQPKVSRLFSFMQCRGVT